jgi:hypothetical protein
MKTLNTNETGNCLSVLCNFYQTCNKNTASINYRTKFKFEPVVENNICHSFDSGHKIEIDLNDNKYPNKLIKLL